jgi:folate-binding protein YgfZ
MEGDLSIARHGDAWYLDAAPVLHESLGLRLEKYLIADDAVFEDLSEVWSLSHVFGPAAPPAPEGGFVVPRNRYGPPGHDVWTPTPAATVVGTTVDRDVVETIRLEHGLPAWDAELTPTTLPPEGGPHMIAAISYTKGCYVGQETIARLKSVGHVNRTLVFLRSRSESFPAPASKLMQGVREAGSITSAGFSPSLKCGIALGYVQRTLADEGTILTTGDLELTVAAPPATS